MRALKKDRMKVLIIRMLLEREASGYQIIKELSSKGLKSRPNYTYRILSEMEKEGSIKGRWAPSKSGPRKHIYSLTEQGQKEFRASVKDSLDLLMGAFTHFNRGIRDVFPVIQGSRMLLDSMGVPIKNSTETKMVIATGGYDPMICYPYEFYAIAEILSDSTIYLVKPPSSQMGESNRNLVVMDGLRSSLPFKDNFADYMFLEGFPKYVSEEKTVKECSRVLKPDGHLIIRLVDELIEERLPKFPHFGSYVSKLFYDMNGQDKVVSVAEVNELLGRYFASQNEAQAVGDLFLYASAKRSLVPSESPAEERISA
jgi:DNA-binding PadR family transcriptional regulator